MKRLTVLSVLLALPLLLARCSTAPRTMTPDASVTPPVPVATSKGKLSQVQIGHTPAQVEWLLGPRTGGSVSDDAIHYLHRVDGASWEFVFVKGKLTEYHPVATTTPR